MEYHGVISYNPYIIDGPNIHGVGLWGYFTTYKCTFSFFGIGGSFGWRIRAEETGFGALPDFIGKRTVFPDSEDEKRDAE